MPPKISHELDLNLGTFAIVVLLHVMDLNLGTFAYPFTFFEFYRTLDPTGTNDH
jgi:hypothetical protein